MTTEKTALRKIARGFQVTLPKEFREKYNLTEGDYLEAREENGAVIYQPVTIDRKKIAAEMDNVFARLDKVNDEFTGMSEDEIMAVVDEQIQEVRKEKRERLTDQDTNAA